MTTERAHGLPMHFHALDLRIADKYRTYGSTAREQMQLDLELLLAALAAAEQRATTAERALKEQCGMSKHGHDPAFDDLIADGGLPEAHPPVSEIPRRIQLDRCTPAELAIYAAMEAVEALPADVRLTDAVELLRNARESVADFIDGVQQRRYVSTQDLQAALTASEGLRQQLEQERDAAQDQCADAERMANEQEQRAMKVEAALQAILDDAVGASHDPLWIVRREFIDEARRLLAAIPVLSSTGGEET